MVLIPDLITLAYIGLNQMEVFSTLAEMVQMETQELLKPMSLVVGIRLEILEWLVES